jgi:hypothetical protein
MISKRAAYLVSVASLVAIACGSEPDAADRPAVDIAPVQAGNPAAARLAGSCGAPIDTNGNGLIEEPEYLSYRGFAFDDWDGNGDGKLLPAEFHACWRAMQWGRSEPAFAALDQDGDGAVDKQEFFEPDAFERADVNANGALDPTESLRPAAS